jgi:arylformamidase
MHDSSAVDYEVEYNNRARVPEWPEHFARWAREAAAYRAQASAHGRAALGLPYGRSPRQTIDLFFAEEREHAPLAVFIHGGWFRSLEPASFSQLAGGLNPHGITVAVPGYDLAPRVTVAQIVDQMRQACLHLWRRFQQPMLVYGHSAGGHLAAAMVATEFSRLDPRAPAALVPSGYAVSGIFDLVPIVQIAVNADLQLDDASAKALSPVCWTVPPGRTLDAVVGALESHEFLRQSRGIVEAWAQQGAKTRYEAIPNTNHFTVVDRLGDPHGAMVQRLVELMP